MTDGAWRAQLKLTQVRTANFFRSRFHPIKSRSFFSFSPLIAAKSEVTTRLKTLACIVHRHAFGP